jgi:putative heme iron utilization protein
MALGELLDQQRVAALGTTDDDDAPFVSMVPFAIENQSCCLVMHVSGLAAHTHNLRKRSKVSVLINQSEVPGAPVHALPRVTLSGLAQVLERGSPQWSDCRAAYLARFPDAVQMTELGDFRFVAIAVTAARQVAGFGAARTLDEREMREVLACVFIQHTQDGQIN